MGRIKMFAGALVPAGLALVLLSGCAAGQPAARPGAMPDTKPAGHTDVTTRAAQCRLAQLQHRLEVAELNLARARTAVEHGELYYHDATTLAEIEFELAKRRQQIFVTMTVPNRIARAELSLQQAEDGVSEAEQDLYQLELKSSDDHRADQPQAAVVERAQRRLTHAQRDLELRREEFQILKEATLPLEQRALELASEEKKRALLHVQRDNEAGLIDRRIAVVIAEAELTRLEYQRDNAAPPASAD
jgi:hypothetical protein